MLRSAGPALVFTSASIVGIHYGIVLAPAGTSQMSSVVRRFWFFPVSFKTEYT
jgi:hypothetical protein